MAEVGQNIGPGMPVAILVKIDQVKVKVSVPEDEIAKIQKGQQVWLRVASANGKVFMGQITEKGVLANPISRSYEVKAMIENPNHELLPGMVCQVGIRGQHASESIVVPANIVQLTPDNKTFVWTVKGNKAQKKYITLGENMTDGVKVESGLSLGDKVIIEGQQKISTGMTIKEENCK
jgi:RND family efflux transporter MFP subunit